MCHQPGCQNEAHVVIARDVALEGAEQNNNEIILILAHGVLAFAFEKSDDFAGEFPEGNPSGSCDLPSVNSSVAE